MNQPSTTPEQDQIRNEILEIQRLAIHIKSYGIKNDILTIHKEPVNSDVLYYLAQYFEVRLNHATKDYTGPSYIVIRDKQINIYIELKDVNDGTE